MINPYDWPFSFFQMVTAPYFKFWSRVFPTIKFQKTSFDISAIIALEALNSIIYLCVRAVNLLIITLESP
jgi:uncharacterized protein YggT (Ycf19 family)